MESILEEVSKNCAVQINDFYSCVEENQTDWKTKCSTLETSLAACSEQYSKRLIIARNKCKDSVQKYENCVKNNQTNPETCISELKDLYNCTNAALEE
ncbi:Coiled-coil-helix-coiled-coil-helix domain-containing protein 5 [Smittium mucronatum]|uniref:Coiled-coil-helix-coiled-coil-helix domain-containing protein 5 n=1 Tax=Smittium mucronatum TaxID=133383 RepID=A0A1R0GW97_9FUNG|nr:Coiled-coil-helix-coiled-coil-helix domain-containing protein 5 [Smittium mucronatum]